MLNQTHFVNLLIIIKERFFSFLSLKNLNVTLILTTGIRWVISYKVFHKSVGYQLCHFLEMKHWHVISKVLFSFHSFLTLWLLLGNGSWQVGYMSLFQLFSREFLGRALLDMSCQTPMSTKRKNETHTSNDRRAKCLHDSPSCSCIYKNMCPPALLRLHESFQAFRGKWLLSHNNQPVGFICLRT